MAIEQIRMILIIALCVVSFLLWDAWQRDYGPRPPPPASTEQPARDAGSGGSTSPGVDVPQSPTSRANRNHGHTISWRTVAGALWSWAEDPGESRTCSRSKSIPWAGPSQGSIFGPSPFPTTLPNEPFRLLDDADPVRYLHRPVRTYRTTVRTEPSRAVRVRRRRLRTRRRHGIHRRPLAMAVGGWRRGRTRTYRFARDNYVVKIRVDVANRGEEAWQGALYGQLQRGEPESPGGLFRTYTYTGGILSGPEKPYEKVDFSDMASQDVDREATGGWVAMIQHYFAAAWIPGSEDTNHYYSKSLPNGRFAIGVVGPVGVVSPGSTGGFSLAMYVGPKIQERMQDVAPHLERTVDYGWLWLIAEPLFWLLSWIHGFVGNWGWAIIILTFLIKLAFFQLSATSYKSMARMRKLQPRITALRERYGADKQRMNQAMMELYRQEKINPLGGCLPILVQIPVFIALYWVLLESVELRQASFIGWLDDLSLHDPYFVLPVAMGVTMLIQQRLNPTPPDPMQAKIMMALPFVFTFFFLFFPSGLVLYWFVNNMLSIIQQWVITKKIVGEHLTSQRCPFGPDRPMNLTGTEDTIAAIATPPGRGGIADRTRFGTVDDRNFVPAAWSRTGASTGDARPIHGQDRNRD